MQRSTLEKVHTRLGRKSKHCTFLSAKQRLMNYTQPSQAVPQSPVPRRPRVMRGLYLCARMWLFYAFALVAVFLCFFADIDDCALFLAHIVLSLARRCKSGMKRDRGQERGNNWTSQASDALRELDFTAQARTSSPCGARRGAAIAAEARYIRYIRYVHYIR